MPHRHNYLRTYRKRSQLHLSDLAFLLDRTNASALGRCERGERTPSLSMLLLYHLLFEAPIEEFFERHLATMKQALAVRMGDLIEMVESAGDTPHNQARERVAFLTSALNRLAS